MHVFSCGPMSYRNDRGKTLLNRIILRFEAPHLAVITGDSGCGKTTLLKAVAGLNKADVMERMIDGETFSLRRLPEWRSKVTLSPQDAPVIDGSVEDNLLFPYAFRNAGRPEPERVVLSMYLKRVGLGYVNLDANVSELSGGERHRLCLVRAILWEPFVLLADEPFSGIEQALAMRCFALVREFVESGPRIAICTTHDELLAQQADSVWRLEDGRLHRA